MLACPALSATMLWHNSHHAPNAKLSCVWWSTSVSIALFRIVLFAVFILGNRGRVLAIVRFKHSVFGISDDALGSFRAKCRHCALSFALDKKWMFAVCSWNCPDSLLLNGCSLSAHLIALLGCYSGSMDVHCLFIELPCWAVTWDQWMFTAHWVTLLSCLSGSRKIDFIVK